MAAEAAHAAAAAAASHEDNKCLIVDCGLAAALVAALRAGADSSGDGGGDAGGGLPGSRLISGAVFRRCSSSAAVGPAAAGSRAG